MTPLVAGDWRLGLLPKLGGAVASLTHRGRHILRPTPEEADDPLQTACFPLVPYANRVLGGRFVFNGREAVLPTLPAFSPHALHGVGWLKPWAVIEAGADRALLVHEHRGDGWPWAYRAEQHFVLGDAGLTVTLSVRNEADEAAPFGLGLHPYFPRGPKTRLTLAGDGAWDPLSPGAPHQRFGADDAMDWSDGRGANGAPFIDHSYSGWDGAARIEQDGHVVVVRGSTATPFVHVFVPTGEDFLCVEPVSHRPDAVNGGPDDHGAMTVLSPGQTLSLTMSVTVEPL